LANHKSAIKRARQNEKRRMRNRIVKTQVRSMTRKLRDAAGQAPAEDLGRRLDVTKSVIDRAARKGVIHKRTAARQISRLSKLVHSATA
jgi:small subunit ribosomal protein S20